MTEWKKPNLQHFLFQAFWILCSSTHYLHSLHKHHSRVLVKFNWNCLKTEETRKINVQNITGWNWRGQNVPRELYPKVTEWKVFFRLFILIFQWLKANTYLVLWNGALCDEFIGYIFFFLRYVCFDSPKPFPPKNKLTVFCAFLA